MAAKRYVPTQKDADDRAAKVAEAKSKLEAAVTCLQSSEAWASKLAECAKSMRSRFGISRLSFRNQLLLMMQGCTGSAATFKSWQGVGRYVKRGEKAMMILQPRPFVRERENDAGEKEKVGGLYFKTLPIFDLGQTEGEPLPEVKPLTESLPADALFAFGLETLRAVALKIEGRPVSGVEVRERRAGDPAEARGWCNVASWSQGREGARMIADSGDRIMKAANVILDALYGDVADEISAAAE